MSTYYNDGRSPWVVRHPVAATLLGVLLLLVLIVGGWLGSVALSDLFGRAGAIQQVNSTANRLGQYDRFVQLDKDIRSQAQQAVLAQQQLDAFNRQYPAGPDESFTVTEQRAALANDATGARQVCISNVNEYNNLAKAYTAQRFRDSNMPAGFDTAACSDPAKLPALLANEGALP